MAPKNTLPRRLLQTKQVLDLMGFTRVTLWRRVRDGQFPRPVKVGTNSNRWYEDEVAKAQADLPRVSYAPAEAA